MTKGWYRWSRASEGRIKCRKSEGRKLKVDEDDGKRRRENEARKVKREKWKKQMRRRWHGTYRKLRVAKCTWARADGGERKWQ